MDCEICGKFCIPRTGNQATCGSRECRAEKKRRTRAAREGRKLQPMDPRPCEICAKVFKPRQSNQEICGDYNCMLEMRRRAAKARYAEKLAKEPHHACPICKKSMIPVRGKAPTCQKRGCIAAWAALKQAEWTATQAETEKRKRAEIAKEEMERKLAAYQCPFAGPWQDEKGRKWDAINTGITGFTWRNPIMDPMSAGWSADGVWVDVECEREPRRKAA